MICDIVLTVWNEPKITRDCIDSLVKHTHYPYRIIIVDNGSQQETMEYLKSLRERRDLDILLIRNEQNVGFVKAGNQGLAAATAPYVCLLSNDTLFGDGWLTEIIKVAEGNPEIGIVNPFFNTSGEYLPDDSAVDSYAKGLKGLKGKWQEMGQCVGFCMFIKKQVMDKIGLLDEIFAPYFFEETDFCRRADKAGFKCAMAKASYVYHIGSATLKKRPSEREKVYMKNCDTFCRRWGRPLSIAYLALDYPEVKQDRIKEIAFSAARDKHRIWMFLKKPMAKPNQVSDHFNISFFWLNRYFYRILCIYKILKRKKRKKIDIIFTEDKVLSSILEKLKFYHEADVFFEPSLEKAKQLWRNKSVHP